MAEWTLKDFAKAHKPARATARICMAMGLWDRHERLQLDLTTTVTDDAATKRDDPRAPGVAEEIKALEAEIGASEQPFTFQSIGLQAWSKLLAEHPPSAEHKDLGHNPATFPPEAIAASAVDPTMTAVTARGMMADLNDSQWNQLYGACLKANIGGGANPKSALATVVLRRAERSSTTAAPEESPEASS